MRAMRRTIGAILVFVATVLAGVQAAPAAARTTILVPLEPEPSWRDMAFLAAVPAACAANSGSPSLIALDVNGGIGAEIQDYAKRYCPDRVYTVGQASQQACGGRSPRLIDADSPESAAAALAKTFWRASRVAVVCADDDYDSALIAAPLAAMLKVPLLYQGSQVASKRTGIALARLWVHDVLVVGV